MKNPHPAKELAAFEHLLLEQKPWQLDKYDEDYFVDDWREGHNDYSLETRRTLEGRNPQLIKEVFEPESVIDLGCGPGCLMALLSEVGINADGIDGSPSSPRIAPECIREKIQVGPITKLPLADDSYDLAISREVFEHLTIAQVFKAVGEMCRVTRRFTYVTTRFHHDPQTLFDVETDFETDPTHITLMNKDMLRLMFVLHGMRCRPDLEARMDWMNKGRCLVYEKQPTTF